MKKLELKKIGFRNFRRFEVFPLLNVNGINILVGRNNSGKSTLIKGAITVLNFLKNSKSIANSGNLFEKDIMSFDNNRFHDTNIGTFKRALYNKAQKNEIVFNVSIGEVDFEVAIVGDPKDENSTSGDISHINICDNGRGISVLFDIKSVTTTIDFGKVESDNSDEIKEILATIKDLRAELKEIKHLKNNSDILRIDDIQSQIKNLNRQKRSLVKTESVQKGKIEIPLSRSLGNLSENIILSYLDGIIEHSNASQDVNNKSSEHKKYMATLNILRDNIQSIMWMRNEIFFTLSSIGAEYIQAFDIKKSLFYSSKDNSDFIAQTIHQYFPFEKNSKMREFVTQWMNKFNVGSDFEIKSLGGEVHTLTISDETGEHVYIADKGTGSIRVMILLLKLAIIINKYKDRTVKPLIFIEEPELNLHPNLQSLLAELFEYINFNYDIKLIIETHSEYMIRKSQVLVASKGYKDEADIENNPFAVYYFHSEDIPYKMEYRTDGKFSNEFGKGFFDEASNLAFEIF